MSNKKDKKFSFFWEKEPADEMEEMRTEIRRMIKDFWKGTPIPSVRVSVGKTFPIDISDEDDKLVLTADLPGFNKKDLSLEVTEDSVNMSGKKTKEKESKGKDFYKRERIGGSVRRSFTLPCKIDPDKTKAKFEDGVLRVELPKKEPSKKEKKKKVDVK